jgi:hypothetical protein
MIAIAVRKVWPIPDADAIGRRQKHRVAPRSRALPGAMAADMRTTSNDSSRASLLTNLGEGIRIGGDAFD